MFGKTAGQQRSRVACSAALSHFAPKRFYWLRDCMTVLDETGSCAELCAWCHSAACASAGPDTHGV